MDELKNRDIASIAVEGIIELFILATFPVYVEILNSVMEKLNPHISTNLTRVLKMSRVDLINLTQANASEEETLINLRAVLRLIDLNKATENVANMELKDLSSYQVCQLFIQKIKTNSVVQALKWIDLLEENSIDGEVLSAGIPKNVYQNLQLNSGQITRFQNIFKKPQSTGLSTIVTVRNSSIPIFAPGAANIRTGRITTYNGSADGQNRSSIPTEQAFIPEENEYDSPPPAGMYN